MHVYCAISEIKAFISSIQGGPKSKPLPYDKKSYSIVLMPVNEIRFIRQVKV